MTAPLTVRGGVNGVEARCEDLSGLATIFQREGLHTGEDAAHLHTVLADPAVLAAAVLDPVGAARFAGRLVDALDGPGGMLVLAGRCGELDVRLRAAVVAYRAADRLRTEAVPALTGLTALPRAVGAAAHGNVAGAGSRLVAGDPWLADTAVDAVSRFWTELGLVHAVATYPDGRAVVSARGPDTSAALAAPPRGVYDVVAALAHRDEGRGGDVDVRFVLIRGADGVMQRRVIVDIPGTKSWSPSPVTPDVTSLGTNLRSITGARTSYENGVLEAMRQAGVRRGEPVLFVGHSQGGMIAVNAARHLAAGGEFTPAGVITLGAPIARLSVPRSVTVLALENDGDVIPHCDGATNPDRVNVTTVTIHRGGPDPGANHALSGGYLTGARDVDTSTDPSVRASLRALHGFFAGDEVRTETYHVSRRW